MAEQNEPARRHETDEQAIYSSAEKIERWVLASIRRGELAPGDRLESERELAKRWTISRANVRKALYSLERAGILRRIRGSGGGTFVTHKKVERNLFGTTALPSYLARQGFQADTQVLATTIRSANSIVAYHLGLPIDSPVYDIVRLRLADEMPLSLDQTFLPAHRFPDLFDHRLSASLTELMTSQYGINFAHTTERIEIAHAQEQEARLLGVHAGDALLSVERVSLDSAGKPVEYSVDLFRGDRTEIVMTSTFNAEEGHQAALLARAKKIT